MSGLENWSHHVRFAQAVNCLIPQLSWPESNLIPQAGVQGETGCVSPLPVVVYQPTVVEPCGPRVCWGARNLSAIAH